MAPTTRARTRAPPAATVTQADQSASPAQPAQSSGPQKNVKRAAKRTKGNEVNQAPPAPPSGVSLANRSFSVNGPIAELPHELLLSILEHMVDGSLEGAKSVILFLSCSKALYTFSLDQRDWIFSRLYHRLLAQGPPFFRYPPVGAPLHPLYSPKLVKKSAGTATNAYPKRRPLPNDAVFDWREQFLGLLIWREGKHCLSCKVSSDRSPLVTPGVSWNIPLCLHCSAKLLIPKSNISNFNVTPGDVANLIPWETRAGSLFTGTAVKVTLYQGYQLQVLALQKHGHQPEHRSKRLDKQAAEEQRLWLVKTFFLLHCGRFFDHCDLARLEWQCASKGVDVGWYAVEFDHAITRKSYKKSSATPQGRLAGKGTPYPTKLRSVETLIQEYHDKVLPHAHDFRDPRVEVQVPVFNPATNPGPCIPSDQSVQAYNTLWTRLQEDKLLGLVLIMGQRNVPLIRACQSYVLSPSKVKLDTVLRLANNLENSLPPASAASSSSSSTKVARPNATPVKASASLNVQPNTASVGTRATLYAGKNMKNSQQQAPSSKSHNTSAAERKARPASLHVDSASADQDLDTLTALELRKEAPDWAPPPLPFLLLSAPKKGDEKSEAAGEKSHSPKVKERRETGQKRLRKINSILRAVSITQIDDATTEQGDPEKLKRSLYKSKSGSTGLAPFGRDYVKASEKQDEQSGRNESLIQVYRATHAARVARITAFVKMGRRDQDPVWANPYFVRCISGRCMAYTTCPASDLAQRTRVPFEEVKAELTEMLEDFRADRMTWTGLDVTCQVGDLGELGGVCPYTPTKTMCSHLQSDNQCWLRHLRPIHQNVFPMFGEEEAFYDSELEFYFDSDNAELAEWL